MRTDPYIYRASFRRFRPPGGKIQITVPGEVDVEMRQAHCVDGHWIARTLGTTWHMKWRAPSRAELMCAIEVCFEAKTAGWEAVRREC